MFEDALPGLEHQVEAWEVGVLGLKLINDTQGLQIVFESTEVTHASVERILPRVAKWGVTEVMRQADRFCQSFVQAQGDSN